MLIIRLQRTGSRNAPDFRLVLAEKHRAASKKVLEVLGQYNPISKKLTVKSEDKLKVWLGRKVELSPTAHNLLVTHKFLDAKKVKAWRPKVKPQAETPAAAQPAAEQAAPEAAAAEPAGATEAPAVRAPEQVAPAAEPAKVEATPAAQ